MKTATLLVLILILLFSTQLKAQTINGKVVDANSEPLQYASIGVVNTAFGTITNEHGIFKLELDTLPETSLVRFSSMGYESQAFKLVELSNKDEIVIQLKFKPIQISEVTVKPGRKRIRKIGVTKYSKGVFTGWAERGPENGTKICFGANPVQIESLHFRIEEHTFDSCVFRIHIRKIVNNLPADELLNENIFVTVSNKFGWTTKDLRQYGLVFRGDIAVTLDFINGYGYNPLDNHWTEKFPERPQMWFNVKRNRISFNRIGSEGKWEVTGSSSPSIYLKVRK